MNHSGIRNSRESLPLLCLEDPREEHGQVEAESVDVTAGESCPVGPVVSCRGTQPLPGLAQQEKSLDTPDDLSRPSLCPLASP